MSAADSTASSATHAPCCAGWNGTACDVCANVAACPRRGNQRARNCSAGAVEPVAEELVSGKRFSCSVCGPGAASTLCLLPTVNAPSASFDLTAFADHAEVAWRLGTYRADAAKFPGQNDFDYAAYLTLQLVDTFAEVVKARLPAASIWLMTANRRGIESSSWHMIEKGELFEALKGWMA